MKHIQKSLLPVLLFTATFILTCSSRPALPKLVMVICVDQMRADYLEKFQPVFGEHGFKRLQRQGVTFQNHILPYSNTETGTGHAVILSGLLPRSNGIVKNKWYEKGTQISVACTRGEPSDTVYGSRGQSMASPRLFIGNTAGDWLKHSSPQSKVFTVSTKPRSAIFLAGKHPNGVYWPHPSNYQMVSSGYYSKHPPAWVLQWNQLYCPKPTFRRTWDYLRDSSLYQSAPMPSFNPFVKSKSWAGGFPHVITHNMFGQSHFQMDLNLTFLQSLIVNEGIGKDDYPDIVAWSISITDYIGHTFGMESHEVMDAYARADMAIENLLRFLDTNVGQGQYAVILTSDHGVRATTRLLQSQGIKGASFIDNSAIIKAFINSLRTVFNIPADKGLNADFRIVRIRGNDVYINRQLTDSLNLPFEDIKIRLLASLKTVPGIRAAYDYEALKPEDAFTTAAYNNYYPGRSGDIVINLDSVANFDVVPGMHGYFGRDCAHVPLIVCIPGQPPATIDRQTSLTDIAPTIARLLRYEIPTPVDGIPLKELFGEY